MKTEIHIKSKDGHIISAIFNAFGNPSIKGVIIAVHGFGEHAGSYSEFAEYMERADYASVLFDQRGHGDLSEPSVKKRKKKLGIIPGYDCFLDDIEAIMNEVIKQKPDMPIMIYGHSMGGNIVINYLLKRGQSGLSCAVLESPWLGLYKEVSPIISGAAKISNNVPSSRLSEEIILHVL